MSETGRKSVFFQNLRAEVVRKYGCGSAEGWINVVAASLGWTFDKARTVIYRYENFEPQQMAVPAQIARAIDVPVDRLVYDPRAATRESYYWKANEELAERAEVAQYERDLALEDLAASREEISKLRETCSFLKKQVDDLRKKSA